MSLADQIQLEIKLEINLMVNGIDFTVVNDAFKTAYDNINYNKVDMLVKSFNRVIKNKLKDHQNRNVALFQDKITNELLKPINDQKKNSIGDIKVLDPSILDELEKIFDQYDIECDQIETDVYAKAAKAATATAGAATGSGATTGAATATAAAATATAGAATGSGATTGAATATAGAATGSGATTGSGAVKKEKTMGELLTEEITKKKKTDNLSTKTQAEIDSLTAIKTSETDLFKNLKPE